MIRTKAPFGTFRPFTWSRMLNNEPSSKMVLRPPCRHSNNPKTNLNWMSAFDLVRQNFISPWMAGKGRFCMTTSLVSHQYQTKNHSLNVCCWPQPDSHIPLFPLRVRDWWFGYGDHLLAEKLLVKTKAALAKVKPNPQITGTQMARMISNDRNLFSSFAS